MQAEAQSVTDSVANRNNRWRSLQSVRREIPDSGNHPGNVHLLGEVVQIRLPAKVNSAAGATQWRLLDDREQTITNGQFASKLPSLVSVGKLSIGWYRLELLDDNDREVAWTTAAVLSPLLAPVPQDSPICIDGAVSWFARNDPKKQEQFSRLAALAGVNWIRDRMKWGEVQPAEDKYQFQSTTYDTAATAETRHGLKVLQVFHDTPRWAIDPGERGGQFPTDLRTIYRFCKELPQQFKGRVQAWEPWNEANVHDFGGHTVDGMCSFQKAAYLGFKATDPNVTVCWNAHAGTHTRLHAQGIIENEVWPYFETYNIHSYDWPHSYPDLWKHSCDAASGRPLWVTEADRGLPYMAGDPQLDLSRKDERLKAEFMAQSYALSLFAGSQRHFHFILGQYHESRNRIQFGLLRDDLTPRPAYVAFAAQGRILAGAKCLGRFPRTPDSLTNIVAFRAQPDGVIRDVLVAWAERDADWPARGTAQIDWPLPPSLRIESAYDYLGRRLKWVPPAKLTSAPMFVVLHEGEVNKLSFEPPHSSKWRDGTPSPIVLQLDMPRFAVQDIKQRRWAQEFHYLVKGGTAVEPSVYVYNFGTTKVQGKLAIDHLPDGWKVTPESWDLMLAPMERVRLKLQIDRPTSKGDRQADTRIKLRADFGNAGSPVLAFRLLGSPGEGYEH